MFTKSDKNGKWALKRGPQIRLIARTVPQGKVMASGQINKFGGSLNIRQAKYRCIRLVQACIQLAS